MMQRKFTRRTIQKAAADMQKKTQLNKDDTRLAVTKVTMK